MKCSLQKGLPTLVPTLLYHGADTQQVELQREDSYV